MQQCCVKQLTEMQEFEELGGCLTFLLKASPYIILVPSLGSGVLNDGARRTAAKQLASITVKAVADKAKGANKLPGVSESVNSAGKIIQLKLSGFAGLHSTMHMGLEYAFWNALQTLYAGQSNAAPEPGWLSGWW